MKKSSPIFTLILLVTLTFAACNGGSGSEAPKSDIKIEDNKEANDIIQFNNKFLQLTKNQSGLLNSAERYFNGVNKYMANPEDRFAIKPIKPIHVSNTINKVSEVPGAFGKLKDEMQKNYDEINKNFDIVSEGINEMERYLSAEDFKDDKGAKAKEIEQRVTTAIAAYDKAFDQLYTKLKPAADDAEAITLKDHPLKEYILSSKKMLEATDSLFKEVRTQYDSDNFNEAGIQQRYTALEAAVKKNTAMTVKVDEPQYKSKESSFSRLNTEADKFLGSARKFMRDSKEKNAIDEDAAEDLNSDYQSLISAYNSFVN